MTCDFGYIFPCMKVRVGVLSRWWCHWHTVMSNFFFPGVVMCGWVFQVAMFYNPPFHIDTEAGNASLHGNVSDVLKYILFGVSYNDD